MPRLSPKLRAHVGIDPGVKGGIVALISFPYGATGMSQWRMPKTIGGVVKLFRELSTTYDCVAVIELVHAMPGNSAKSMFAFGKGYGVLLSCLVAFGIDYTTVTPRVWQKSVGIRPKGKTETKAAWKARLARYASATMVFSFDEYTADAALMASHCAETSTVIPPKLDKPKKKR